MQRRLLISYLHIGVVHIYIALVLRDTCVRVRRQQDNLRHCNFTKHFARVRAECAEFLRRWFSRVFVQFVILVGYRDRLDVS